MIISYRINIIRRDITLAGTNPKLAFIKDIAAQSKKHEHEISSNLKSILKNLESRPKPYYTIQDVEEIVEGIRNFMINMNKIVFL